MKAKNAPHSGSLSQKQTPRQCSVKVIFPVCNASLFVGAPQKTVTHNRTFCGCRLLSTALTFIRKTQDYFAT